jgi:hypothetical protein
MIPGPSGIAGFGDRSDVVDDIVTRKNCRCRINGCFPGDTHDLMDGHNSLASRRIGDHREIHCVAM